MPGAGNKPNAGNHHVGNQEIATNHIADGRVCTALARRRWKLARRSNAGEHCFFVRCHSSVDAKPGLLGECRGEGCRLAMSGNRRLGVAWTSKAEVLGSCLVGRTSLLELEGLLMSLMLVSPGVVDAGKGGPRSREERGFFCNDPWLSRYLHQIWYRWCG